MAPLAVQVGDLRIGVRAQDQESQVWLTALLAPLVVDDQDVSANYSLRRSNDPRALHLLYWGGCLVARSRTEDELVRALDAHLGGHTPPPPTAVRLDAIALRRGDDVVVLTHVDPTFVAKVLGRLRDPEVHVEVRPWVDVDAETMQMTARPTVGLCPDERPAPMVRSLVLPVAVAQLPIGDRLLTLQRTGALELVTAATALHFLGRVSTQGVGDYDVSRVAESVRASFG